MHVLSGTVSRTLSPGSRTLTVTHTDLYGGSISIVLERHIGVHNQPYLVMEKFSTLGHYAEKSLRNKLSFIFDLIFFGICDKRFLPRDTEILTHLTDPAVNGSRVSVTINGSGDDARLVYSDGHMFCSGRESAGVSGEISVGTIPLSISAAYDSYMAPKTYVECFDR